MDGVAYDWTTQIHILRKNLALMLMGDFIICVIVSSSPRDNIRWYSYQCYPAAAAVQVSNYY